MLTLPTLSLLPTDLSYGELPEILRQLPRAKSKKIIEHNLALISELGTATRMTALLSELLADRDHLAAAAARSYRHVNHFDKIVLVDSRDTAGYRLTLHFWCPPYTEAELDDELIHDHRFSFWSNILTGRLNSVDFAVSAASDQIFQRYRYSPERDKVTTTSNFYEFTGTIGLAHTGNSQKITGESYYLSYERIHRVLLPREQVTCTLVLRGPRERHYSNVFNTTYPSQDTRLANVMFTPEQLDARLNILLRAILSNRGQA
jgi:hypothetical protein